MTSVTATSNQDPSADLEKTIKDFKDLVKKPESPAAEKNLWYAWHFLQVYSNWGLGIPHTEASLKLQLAISEPGQFVFFNVMKEGYNEIHEACGEFVSEIFPKVIEVGTSLLHFASDASTGDGELFSVLIELIDTNDTNGALELIGDLQETAKANKKKAEDVGKLLGRYKGKLASAKAKVNLTQKQVDEDEKTSQAAIDKLAAGADQEGSLAQLNQLLGSKKDEYTHNVLVASTTVTYFWVAFPGGLIAAATVAGVYGDKAVKTLNDVHRLEDEIKKGNAELKTAIEVNKIQRAAFTSLAETQHYTDLAIVHTTTVQNAWQAIFDNLKVVADKVAKMTTGDEQTVLQNQTLVKNYAKNAGEKWALLIPPLKELTRDPYIVVAEGEKSLGELATEVQKEIAKQAA